MTYNGNDVTLARSDVREGGKLRARTEQEHMSSGVYRIRILSLQ